MKRRNSRELFPSLNMAGLHLGHFAVVYAYQLALVPESIYCEHVSRIVRNTKSAAMARSRNSSAGSSKKTGRSLLVLLVAGAFAVTVNNQRQYNSQSLVDNFWSSTSSSLQLLPAACTSSLPPHGIPIMQDYNKNMQSCLYRSLEQYSNDWMELHRATISKYAWVKDPFHWWSRTYEYVFHVKYVTEELDRLQSARGGGDSGVIQVLDARAGTDFISWYLLEEWPSSPRAAAGRLPCSLLLPTTT